MSVTTHEFNTDSIGSWGDPDEFAVERERIKAYAAATNDPIAAHAAGDVAPPVFAVVPAFGALAAATTGVIPGEVLMMAVHGEQDFHFHAPIRPDTTLVTRAVPVGVQGRSSGVTVAVKGETRDAGSDELLVEQCMTSFVRGAQFEGAVGEAPPPHGFDDGLRAREPDEGSSRPSTRTRPSATPRPPGTRCRSTSTTRWPRRWGCRGSSCTACARWPSPRWRRYSTPARTTPRA